MGAVSREFGLATENTLTLGRVEARAMITPPARAT
jgi:hypothetical protein